LYSLNGATNLSETTHKQRTKRLPNVTTFGFHWWLGGRVVMALELRLDGRKSDSWPLWLVLVCVTVFRRANHLCISQSHSGQLSLLPSVGREMSTGQSAVTLSGWGVKTGMVHSTHG